MKNYIRENSNQIAPFVIVTAIIVLMSCFFWHLSNNAMNEYDNQANTCEGIASEAHFDNSDYGRFMVDCLDVSR